MAGNVHEWNTEQFQEGIQSGVTLVDFWAPWCGPCRQQAPILDEAAGEVDGSATVAKVNVDDHPEPAQQNGVQGIPTLILFKNGEPVERFVGVQDKETLVGAIRTHAGATA